MLHTEFITLSPHEISQLCAINNLPWYRRWSLVFSLCSFLLGVGLLLLWFWRIFLLELNSLIDGLFKIVLSFTKLP